MALSFCFFAILSADDFYYGGQSRLMALGGQSAAIEDISSAGDAYSYGFASAIFTRPAVNIIYLNPRVNKVVWDRPDETGDSYPDSDNNVITGNDDGIVFRSGGDACFTLKPYAASSGGHNTEGFYAEGVQRFFGRFSAGAGAGYYWYNYNFIDNAQTLGKPFYQVSLSLLPEAADGWLYDGLGF